MKPVLGHADEAALLAAQARIEASPMAAWLQLSASLEEDRLLYRLAFGEQHIGNPLIRAMHGGVVSALLETASHLEVSSHATPAVSLRTISCQVSYLRGAVDQDMTAAVTVTRLGRRIAFCEATGWQTTEDEPVARAQVALRVFA
jgi:uncharacterized protein (TIGR00369 family)